MNLNFFITQVLNLLSVQVVHKRNCSTNAKPIQVTDLRLEFRFIFIVILKEFQAFCSCFKGYQTVFWVCRMTKGVPLVAKNDKKLFLV